MLKLRFKKPNRYFISFAFLNYRNLHKSTELALINENFKESAEAPEINLNNLQKEIDLLQLKPENNKNIEKISDYTSMIYYSDGNSAMRKKVKLNKIKKMENENGIDVLLDSMMVFQKNYISEVEEELENFNNDKESGAFWRNDGKSFVLADISKLISNSLPKYFRHSNISSFIRQLNLYGFKKLVGEDIEENTYYHEKFKKNYITELKPIRSFYNQEKYGHSKKMINIEPQPVSVESIQSSLQPDCLGKTEGFENSESQQSYKEKLAYLEKENERLRAIEQEHYRLLSLINSNSSGLCHFNFYPNQSTTNTMNLLTMEKGPSTINLHPVESLEYNFQNQDQKHIQNFSYYQNAYYIPF